MKDNSLVDLKTIKKKNCYFKHSMKHYFIACRSGERSNNLVGYY